MRKTSAPTLASLAKKIEKLEMEIIRLTRTDTEIKKRLQSAGIP